MFKGAIILGVGYALGVAHSGDVVSLLEQILEELKKQTAIRMEEARQAEAKARADADTDAVDISDPPVDPQRRATPKHPDKDAKF